MGDVITGQFGQKSTKRLQEDTKPRDFRDIPDLIEYLQEGFDPTKLEETRSELRKLGMNPADFEP